MCLFFILFPTKETPSYHSLIHVPTRGTTSLMLTFRNYATRFNPRSHKGNDVVVAYFQTVWNGFNPRSHKGNDSNSIQIFSYFIVTSQQFFSIPTLSSPSFPSLSSFSHLFCANFSVRIPQGFYVCFLFAPNYKINVWSWAIPLSTPMCSTFVWYLFPK